ncbi:MAG: hypothetical protein MO846_11915 [Candidatus Devosia symbiotica]|nr:hypothetical protein [Candidatus Devosia symbiotica]
MGLDPRTKLTGPVYSDASLAFDAAISEQGELMAADMVSDGRLVRPFGQSVEGTQDYFLVMAKGRRESKKLRVLHS